nr:ATP-binding cassette domain-containing protein [Polymorphum gilvum]
MLLRLSAAVAPGTALTVMGPSGSGKSSLLAFVAGFLDPAFTASGTVRLDGETVTRKPPNARRVGLLFQAPLLFPHLSVRGNLLFAIPSGAGSRQERMALAEAALEEAGLDGLGDRDPAALSGGQQARVALMRVLLSKPRALLLDEPFSSLDAALKEQMRQVVFAKARERGLPVLLVTHDPEDARAAGGRIVDLGT